MKSASKQFWLLGCVVVSAATLSACGGGGDAAAESGSLEVAVTCDTSLFSTSVTSPTQPQAAAYIGTYSGQVGDFDMSGTFTSTGTATLVVTNDGDVTYNGTPVDVKSLCYESGTSSQTLYLHWGNKTTVGAGAVYDHHIDLRSDGTFSGYINNQVFRSTPVI